MSLKELFGKKIKNLRESLFFSQETLAEKIGVHRNTLARIENGKTFPSLETIELLKNVFQIKYSDLFSFSENSVVEDPLKALNIRFQTLTPADIKYFLTSIEAYLKAKDENKKL